MKKVSTEYRNSVKHKKLRSSYGELLIDVRKDCYGDFELQIVPKRKNAKFFVGDM